MKEYSPQKVRPLNPNLRKWLKVKQDLPNHRERKIFYTCMNDSTGNQFFLVKEKSFENECLKMYSLSQASLIKVDQT